MLHMPIQNPCNKRTSKYSSRPKFIHNLPYPGFALRFNRMSPLSRERTFRSGPRRGARSKPHLRLRAALQQQWIRGWVFCYEGVCLWGGDWAFVFGTVWKVSQPNHWEGARPCTVNDIPGRGSCCCWRCAGVVLARWTSLLYMQNGLAVEIVAGDVCWGRRGNRCRGLSAGALVGFVVGFVS